MQVAQNIPTTFIKNYKKLMLFFVCCYEKTTQMRIKLVISA